MLFATRDLARGQVLKAEDFELRVAVAEYREVAVSSLEGVVLNVSSSACIGRRAAGKRSDD